MKTSFNRLANTKADNEKLLLYLNLTIKLPNELPILSLDYFLRRKFSLKSLNLSLILEFHNMISKREFENKKKVPIKNKDNERSQIMNFKREFTKTVNDEFKMKRF